MKLILSLSVGMSAFSLEAMVARYEAVYAQVLAEQGMSSRLRAAARGSRANQRGVDQLTQRN